MTRKTAGAIVVSVALVGLGAVFATRGPEVVIPAGARYRVRLADSLIVDR